MAATKNPNNKADFYNGIYRGTLAAYLILKLMIFVFFILGMVLLFAKLINHEFILEGFRHHDLGIIQLLSSILIFFLLMIISKKLSDRYKIIYDKALDEAIEYNENLIKK